MKYVKEQIIEVNKAHVNFGDFHDLYIIAILYWTTYLYSKFIPS